MDEIGTAETASPVEAPPLPPAFGLSLLIPMIAVFAWFLIQFWTGSGRAEREQSSEENDAGG